MCEVPDITTPPYFDVLKRRLNVLWQRSLEEKLHEYGGCAEGIALVEKKSGLVMYLATG
jgi:hypothetical protein